MNLFSDFVTAVQDHLTIGTESTLFPPALIKRFISRAYLKSAGLFRWPETEDAKKTSTKNGQEIYDYPDSWRPDTIWKLTVDGVRYGEDPDGSPLAFEDYLNWQEDNSTSTDKKWANQWRRYFIHPTPTTNGNNNIILWGQRIVDDLVNDGDVTIFSYSLPECNEAIVLESVAMLKNKGEDQKSGQFLSIEAKHLLVVTWNKIKQEQGKYKKIQPLFYVPDMFKGKSNLKDEVIGNFD